MRYAFWLALILASYPLTLTAFDLNSLGRSLGSVMEDVQKGSKAVQSLRKGIDDLTPREEHFLGRSVAAQLFAQYPPVNRKAINTYMNLLGNYLTQYSERPETYSGYNFQLVRSDQVNGFAAPSGYILITEGLYRLLETEDQLAAVLAHEIAHVTARHGLSAIQTSNLTQAFVLIAEMGIDQKTEQKLSQLTDIFDASISDIINQLVVSGYSSSQEMEADRLALATLYRSGYNPQALIEFFHIMDRQRPKGQSASGFYQTHPSVAKRIAAAEQFLKTGNMQVAQAQNARDQRFRRQR